MTRPASTLTVKTPLRQVVAVNAMLAYAFILGGAAWLMWPGSALWWQFYPISIMTGAASVSLAVKALALIVKIRRFERDQREFQAQGKPVKKASLAEQDFLTRKGVTGHDQ